MACSGGDAVLQELRLPQVLKGELDPLELSSLRLGEASMRLFPATRFLLPGRNPDDRLS